MKVCELVERLKGFDQLADVKVHMTVDTPPIKFVLEEPIYTISSHSARDSYNSDRGCYLVVQASTTETTTQ
jgi:hypothetical protein